MKSTSSVLVTSEHTLQCANEACRTFTDTSISLGVLDQLVAPFIPVAVVYVYQAPIAGSELIPVGRLIRALSLLLDYYPILTGRLHINESDGKREINRIGTGASLRVAECDARLDTFYSPPSSDAAGRLVVTNLPDGGNALLPPWDVEGICRDPIFTVQHTRFACGGVALGVRLPHTVTDSDGYFQVMRDLAELYRGLRVSEASGGPPIATLTQPPHIKPWLGELLDEMTPEDRQEALAQGSEIYHVQSVDTPSNHTADSASPSSPFPPPVTGRIVRFSGEELVALKAHATDPTSGGWISTFDALSAHIYQAVYRAKLKHRQSQGNEGAGRNEPFEYDFLTSVNIRSRLGLPPRYIYNALATPVMSVPSTVLAHGPLSQVAAAIHASTRTPRLSPPALLQTARWIAAQPDKRTVQMDVVRPTFMVSQWCKQGMYAGADFDVDACGKPVPPTLVSPPFTPISLVDGLVYFLATEEQFYTPYAGNASIDVAIALSAPLWRLLDEDVEFRRFRAL